MEYVWLLQSEGAPLVRPDGFLRHYDDRWREFKRTLTRAQAAASNQVTMHPAYIQARTTGSPPCEGDEMVLMSLFLSPEVLFRSQSFRDARRVVPVPPQVCFITIAAVRFLLSRHCNKNVVQRSFLLSMILTESLFCAAAAFSENWKCSMLAGLKAHVV